MIVWYPGLAVSLYCWVNSAKDEWGDCHHHQMFSFQYRGVHRVCSRGQDGVHHCVIQALPALHIKTGETSVVHLIFFFTIPWGHFHFFSCCIILQLTFWHVTLIWFININLIVDHSLLTWKLITVGLLLAIKAYIGIKCQGFSYHSLLFLIIFMPNANARHHPFKNLPEEMHLKRTQFYPQPYFLLCSQNLITKWTEPLITNLCHLIIFMLEADFFALFMVTSWLHCVSSFWKDLAFASFETGSRKGNLRWSPTEILTKETTLAPLIPTNWSSICFHCCLLPINYSSHLIQFYCQRDHLL